MSSINETELEVLSDLYEMDRQMFIHHEDQRAAIANLFMSAAAGLITILYVIQTNLDGETKKSIAWLAFFAALYGWIMSEKLSERADLHIKRSRLWLKEIYKLCPGLDLEAIKRSSDRRHFWRSILMSLFNVRWLWRIMFIALILLAAGLAFDFPSITEILNYLEVKFRLLVGAKSNSWSIAGGMDSI